jgi:hypothetical protein
MKRLAASRFFPSLFAICLIGGCAPVIPLADLPNPTEPSAESVKAASSAIDAIADAYLELTLEAGTHEAEWVDAYYGPADIRKAVEAKPRSKAQLTADARELTAMIDGLIARGQAAISKGGNGPRIRALRGMLVAAETRLQMLEGKKFSFADEAKGQLATIPQLKPLSHYDTILTQLDKDVPGTGPLATRVDAFNERYVIPKEKLQTVFNAAIAECKRRTAAHMQLPIGESFTMEFVTGKPWSGYNYYQGGYKSLIQINTDLPIRISRAVDLGCHEGYPGHHVLNLMIESKLARSDNGGKGWKEFQVNPLYSPQSVISEGSANYGIDLAFPAAERLKFERDVLYPLAGLDPKTAKAYWDLQQATDALSGARLTIAKLYLDGEIDRPKALELKQKYQLLSPARAEQQVGFTDHYRSYVLNYGWGKELVKAYIERGNPEKAERWKRMEMILSEPVLPADLESK